MVLAVGSTLRSESGTDYRIVSEIGAGGQAVAFKASELGTGRDVAVKLFHAGGTGASTESRTRFLIGQGLHRSCPALCGPVQFVRAGGSIGHVAPWASGILLEDFLAGPPRSFLEHVQLALSLAHVVDRLHGRQLAHGDLSARNLMVAPEGEVLRLCVIDLDNFAAPRQAPPPCLGQILYMAPEVHDGRSTPDVATDLFSLAVLLHEILLLVHPFCPGAATPAEFQANLECGWLHDPQNPIARGAADARSGYDSRLLDEGLARLFRAGLGRDPGARPSAAHWVEGLSRALTHVFICPRDGCGYPTLVDPSKRDCPGCARPYPLYRVVATGFQAVVDAAAMPLGRAQLGDPTVSNRHAVLRRLGPEAWLETLDSLNGTHAWTGASWSRLKPGARVLLRPGARFRLGSVELRVEPA